MAASGRHGRRPSRVAAEHEPLPVHVDPGLSGAPLPRRWSSASTSQTASSSAIGGLPPSWSAPPRRLRRLPHVTAAAVAGPLEERSGASAEQATSRRLPEVDDRVDRDEPVLPVLVEPESACPVAAAGHRFGPSSSRVPSTGDADRLALERTNPFASLFGHWSPSLSSSDRRAVRHRPRSSSARPQRAGEGTGRTARARRWSAQSRARDSGPRTSALKSTAAFVPRTVGAAQTTRPSPGSAHRSTRPRRSTRSTRRVRLGPVSPSTAASSVILPGPFGQGAEQLRLRRRHVVAAARLRVDHLDQAWRGADPVPSSIESRIAPAGLHVDRSQARSVSPRPLRT